MKIDETGDVPKIQKRNTQKMKSAFENRKRGQKELLSFVRENKLKKTEIICEEFQKLSVEAKREAYIQLRFKNIYDFVKNSFSKDIDLTNLWLNNGVQLKYELIKTENDLSNKDSFLYLCYKTGRQGPDVIAKTVDCVEEVTKAGQGIDEYDFGLDMYKYQKSLKGSFNNPENIKKWISEVCFINDFCEINADGLGGDSFEKNLIELALIQGNISDVDWKNIDTVLINGIMSLKGKNTAQGLEKNFLINTDRFLRDILMKLTSDDSEKYWEASRWSKTLGEVAKEVAEATDNVDESKNQLIKIVWELFVRSQEDYKYSNKINNYYDCLADFENLEKNTVRCSLGNVNISFPMTEKEMESFVNGLENPLMLNITINTQKVLIGTILNEYLDKSSANQIKPGMRVCNILFTDRDSCSRMRANYWHNNYLNIGVVLSNASRAYVDTKGLLCQARGLNNEIRNTDVEEIVQYGMDMELKVLVREINDVQMIQEYVIKCLQNNVSEFGCYEEKMAALIDENVMKISLEENNVLKQERKVSIKRKF